MNRNTNKGGKEREREGKGEKSWREGESEGHLHNLDCGRYDREASEERERERGERKEGEWGKGGRER